MSLPVRPPRHEVLRASETKERGGVLAVLNGQSRKGDWTMPRELRVACVMGSVELDLREARIPEGTSTINVYVLVGSVEILFPPGVRVELDGDAIAGQFTHEPDSTMRADPDAPVVRLTGTAFLGSVEGQVRYAGESRRDARRRLKAGTRERR